MIDKTLRLTKINSKNKYTLKTVKWPVLFKLLNKLPMNIYRSVELKTYRHSQLAKKYLP